MRVLFSSTVGHGHVFPMVPLAQAFTAAGHEVRWAAHPLAGALIEAAGIAWSPAGLRGAAFDTGLDALRQQAALLPPPERAAFMYPTMFGALLAPPMAVDLLDLARSWRPDLLVHEQGELAAPLVAAVLALPRAIHSFGGAVPPPIVASAGEVLAPTWAAYGLEVPPYAGCFTGPFLDICPPAVRPVPLDHVPVVQPLRPSTWSGPPGPLPELPPGSAPLVYLTLGTVPHQPATMQAALRAVADLDVRLLVTVGPQGGGLGPQPGHVRVERYVAQSDLLPRCDLVVSHAGSGTFLGALAHGLPQLCLPQAADQFRNAAAGVRAGVALSLHPADADPDAIRSAVADLLGDPALRRSAGQVADQIAAMPAPAEVVEILAVLA